MKKYGTRIAAFLMILLGLLRGAGGSILLWGSADELDTDLRMQASEGAVCLAGYSLLVVCLLLIVAGLILTIRHDRIAWMVSWVSLALFLAGGMMNGFLLFGHLLGTGQLINFSISGIIALLLIWSKQALRK